MISPFWICGLTSSQNALTPYYKLMTTGSFNWYYFYIIIIIHLITIVSENVISVWYVEDSWTSSPVSEPALPRLFTFLGQHVTNTRLFHAGPRADSLSISVFCCGHSSKALIKNLKVTTMVTQSERHGCIKLRLSNVFISKNDLQVLRFSITLFFSFQRSTESSSWKNLKIKVISSLPQNCASCRRVKVNFRYVCRRYP